MSRVDIAAGTVRARLSPVLACVLVLAVTQAAGSDCLGLDCAEWQHIWGDAHQPTGYASVNGWLVHAISGTVHVQEQGSGAALSTFSTSGIARTPAIADLGIAGFPQVYVFVAARDGRLYKLDLAPPLPLVLPVAKTGNKLQVRDIKRDSCSSDTLLAEPVVQRVAESNPQFTLGKDIVMVATAHGCGDTTQNQVMAFDAADVTGEPLWVFNNGSYEVASFRSCQLDLSRNRLVCGAEHPAASFQYSLFSINTTNGSLAWAAVADTGVHARVALGAADGPGAANLYVGDQSGHVRSFDAADGAPRGDNATVGETNHVRSIDDDLASADGVYAGLILATGSDGVLHALFDSGSDVVPVWDSFQSVVSGPAILSTLGMVYAGANDGKFYQFDLSTGGAGASAVIGLDGPSFVYPSDRSMELTIYLGDDGGYQLVGSFDDPDYGTQSRQYRLPCRWLVPSCVPDVLIFQNGFEQVP